MKNSQEPCKCGHKKANHYFMSDGSLACYKLRCKCMEFVKASESASSDSVIGETKQKHNSSCADERSPTNKNARIDRLKANPAPEKPLCKCGHTYIVHSGENESVMTACVMCYCGQYKPQTRKPKKREE